MQSPSSQEPYTVWWQKVEAPNQFGKGVKESFGLSSQIATSVAAIALIRYLGRK